MDDEHRRMEGAGPPWNAVLQDAPNEFSALVLMASRYRLLWEMARLLSRKTDARELASVVVDKMAGIVEFERCSIATINGDGATFTLRSQTVPARSSGPVERTGLRLEHGVSGRAIRRERTTYLPDYDPSANMAPLADPDMEGGACRSILSLPLSTAGRVFGALTIGARRPNAYSAVDIRMARQVADVLAVGMDRESGRERAARLEGKLESERVQLSETVEQLEAATLELDAFVYAASHDLRAPLLSISGLTDLAEFALGDGNLDDLREHLRRIRRNVKRLDGVVVDMLQLSRARRMEHEVELTDIAKLIGHVVESLWAMDEASDVDLRVQCSIHTRVWLERRRMRQILSNLLSNSIKYRDREKAHQLVVVEALTVGDDLVFRVIDNGLGIAAKNRERVFEMFYRGSKHSYGSGLGLYLVRQHVLALGGTVRLVSADGQTVFEVRVPLGRSE